MNAAYIRSGFLVAVLAAPGCGSPPAGGNGDGGVDLAPPPMICKTPAPPSGTWFSEVTAQMGVTALGTAVRAADLDGDGFPDLFAAVAHIAARDTPMVRYHYLLMNRPDPTDPRRRIFVDTTLESGLLATRDGIGGRGISIVNFGDLNNDGTVDVVACPAATDVKSVDECAAFLNDGTAHFKLAPAGELEGVGVFQATGAALLDYDRDGLLDFWPGNFGFAPYLFHGHGDGTFKDVAAAMGLPTVDGDPAMSQSFRRTFGVTACDLDGDGDQDVLLADYGREANQVWRNDGTTFTEIGAMLGVNWDDRMDFSDDESYRCWCVANPGACPMSLPKPVVTCGLRPWIPGESDKPWRLGGNNFSLACGDLDDDGDMDLMSATIRHWDVGSAADPSELLLNTSPPGTLGKFTRPGNAAMGLTRVETGGWNEGDMMPVFADVDLDGKKDIYLTSSDYPGDHGWLWRQKADHTFEDVTVISGVGQKEIHGVVLVDLDLDGDLDLVAGTSTARGVAATNALRVYRNDIGQAQNFIQIHLEGLGAGHSNRSAIGARVRVTTQGHTQTQEVSGGYGVNAIQNDLVLTFGLGATCTVDQIEVRWPDAKATVQTFSSVQANYRVDITEGAAAVRYVVR